ncbi:hypothetical protein GCM10009546_03480 [Actinomadura livida]|uniref:DUF8175 domain-containing protein n=1 Tax=Actinomadura livida TaxID=79909 RepID=A0ABN1DJ38_9ACTN|nr:hypothetical protein GCM10010208_29720 [Actinomadura livida]
MLGVAGCTGEGQEAAPTARPESPAASPARADGCITDDGNQSIPSTAPRQVYWKRFKGVALPFSPVVGPLDVKGDIARCYQHTPRGALFAAVQISVRLDRSTEWQKIMKRQVVEGEGKAAYARVRTAGQVVPAAKAAQIAGFRIVSYTPQTAVVGTVSRDPARGGRTARTVTVKWEGDWKLAPTGEGSTGSEPERVDSLSGFVFWGGF